MRIATKFLSVLAAATLLPAAASAAGTTITYIGALVDTGSSWRTPSAANDVFALSPTGVLGSDGYYIPGDQGVASQASYVTTVAPNSLVYGGNGGYASIDNPTTTPGASPSQLTTGTFNPFPGTGGSATTFSFTLAANAPNRVRLGLLVDNLDVNIFNSSAVQVTGLSSFSPNINLSAASFNNRLADWVYFDIFGGAGESFSIVNFGGQQGCACLGGVSFDSVVPEPATWLLMVAGFGLVGTAVRRQPKAVAA